MRLDEAKGDAQIGADEGLGDVDGDSAGGCAQVAVVGKDLGVVIVDRIIRRDVGAEDFVEFSRRCDAVQAGGDADRNALGRNPGFVEDFEHDGQGAAIGRRAGDVAHGDGGGLLAFRHLAQGRAADGVFEGGGQGGVLVNERCGRLGLKQLIFKT